jgi:hypothetical protein
LRLPDVCAAATFDAITTMIVELYDALRAAGAPEDKAQAAAKALAEHDRRFGSIEKELAGIHAEIKAVRADVKAVKRKSRW